MRTTKDATIAPAAGHPVRPTSVGESAAERVVNWFRKHPNVTSWGAVAIILAGGLGWWTLASARQTEAVARASLQSGRMAFESRNFGFATSELAGVREKFSGTKAAEEATLLLAQVRMLQGQNDQAIQLLQEFAPGASRDYQSQGFSLLGAALENAGRLPDAAQAYERAGDAAKMPFLKAQALSDAGRVWVAAKDTAKAVAVYKRIATDLKETGPATEAAVRLGELTKGTSTP